MNSIAGKSAPHSQGVEDGVQYLTDLSFSATEVSFYSSLLLQPLRNYLPRPQIKDGVRKVGLESVLFVKRVKRSRQKTHNINLESTFLQIN